MVSLKKEQQVREYTPVHLMDEDEAVRTYCPPKEDPIANGVEVIDKQANDDLLPAINEDYDNKPVKGTEKEERLGVWEWIKLIFRALSFVLLVEALACLFYDFLLSILNIDNATCVKNLAELVANIKNV